MEFVRNIPAHLDKHRGQAELLSLDDASVRNLNTAWGGQHNRQVLQGRCGRRRQSGNRSVFVGQLSSPHSQCGSVYSPDGIAPTICACTHGYAIYHILVRAKL